LISITLHIKVALGMKKPEYMRIIE